MRTDVLAIGFDDYTLDEAVERGMELINGSSVAVAVTPNPEIVYIAQKDEELKKILLEAELVLADGVGITYGAKILGRPIKGTVPGIDFAGALMDKMRVSGKKLFLFGSKPGIAERAAENLLKEYSGLEICGTNDGYFDDSLPIVEKINNSGADVLFVCLGAPKQEKWMAEYRDMLDVKLMVGLGGSLDVFAGAVERAPEKWRKLKLEWLYRLKKEPRRIGRMMKLPLFVFKVIGQRIRGK